MESKQHGHSSHVGHKAKSEYSSGVDEKLDRLAIRDDDAKPAVSRFAEPKSDHGNHHSGSKAESRAHKAAILEQELDAEVDDEFEAMLRQPNVGKAIISDDPHAQRIALGFRINYMNMRDAVTGKLMWESNRFNENMFEMEMQESVPKSILSCRSISREINFTSRETIDHFRIEQRVFFQGQVIEEWLFNFGFVIRGSTNTWQQTIDAAPEDQMLPADELSGKVTFETAFYDGSLFICKNLVRIFYM